MRKGRSQRKTRGSLPPTTKRPQSRPHSDGAGAGAAGERGGPQVVVGLTAPRSEESFDTRSENVAPLETISTRAHAPEAQRLELVRERSLEIVRESLELVREELQERDAQVAQEPQADTNETDTNVDAAPVEMRAETLSFDPPETFHDAPDSGPGAQAVTVRPSESVNVPSLKVLTPDEMSIPPVGDLSVEPIADRFFSEGELVAARNVHGSDESEDWDERAHKSVRKSLPEVVQRRARFAKYVRWAVGGAAVVCLAALARTALPPSASGSGERASAARASLEAAPVVSPVSPAEAPAPAAEAPVAPPAAKAAAAEVVQAPDSVAAPVVAVPAAEPAAAAPVAEAAKAADPTPAKAADPSAAAPAAGGDEKTALQEKNDSRRALERGKVADAIAAGERSVALDPTDGEAWLLLGAAYQEKGNNAEARRCYSSCVKEGKRGPVGECHAMLR